MSIGIGNALTIDSLKSGGVDIVVDPPVVISAEIDETGTALTINFDSAVIGHNGFSFSASGGGTPLTYVSGSGSDQEIFELGRVVEQSETGTVLDYSGGNVSNGTTSLEDINDFAVTNNSTVGSSPPPPSPPPTQFGEAFIYFGLQNFWG